MGRLLKFSVVFFALSLLTSFSHAQSRSPDGRKIRIENAWARRAPMMKSGSQGGSMAGSGNGAVYLTIVNSGSIPDDLLAGSSDAAEAVELHESYEESGMMKMRPVPKLSIPAGGKLEMKPGGYHIMLENLKRDLKVGQAVNLTLTFQKAGKRSVKAKVK